MPLSEESDPFGKQQKQPCTGATTAAEKAGTTDAQRAAVVVAVEVVRFNKGVADQIGGALVLLQRFPFGPVADQDCTSPCASAESLQNVNMKRFAPVQRGGDLVALFAIHRNDGIGGNVPAGNGGDAPAVAGGDLVYFLVKCCHGVGSFWF